MNDLEYFISNYGDELIDYANEMGITDEQFIQESVLDMSQQAGLTLTTNEIEKAKERILIKMGY